jgi:hypothetical protein
MKQIKLKRSLPVLWFLLLIGGCAAMQQTEGDMVEMANPGLTMSPNAPETIWVPRSSVEKGVPRGGELAKRGYHAVTGAKPPLPAPVPLYDTAGNPAALLPHFGLVVAQEGGRNYLNLGKEDGVKMRQILKLYRGGTVVKGLGLAPGAAVGTIEVSGFVGSNGSFGVVKQGGPIKVNDLVGFE